VSEWISVKDQMPHVDPGDFERSDEVLICTDGGVIAIATLEHGQGEAFWSSDNLNGPTDLNEVTHWMPMPEPPKP
jgi:hypothetical protein